MAGYIPVLLVLGLLAVIPYVLESLALNYVRLKSHSLVQRVSSIATSIFNY